MKEIWKSGCCGAKILTLGGGYDGYDIVPIVVVCEKCKRVNSKHIRTTKGRPKKVEVPF